LQYDTSVVFLLGFGKAMQHSFKFQKICYGTQCIFLDTLCDVLQVYCKCITSVLNSFEHEQYPSKSNIHLWCLIIEYLNEGISFLVGFGRAMQNPITCQKTCYGAQYLSGIPYEGYCRCIE
jgi:hypothetical protein